MLGITLSGGVMQARSLIPYLLYLVALVTLLITVHEPGDRTLKARTTTSATELEAPNLQADTRD